MYLIFLNCQCLNDLRVRIYDLVTLTTWLITLVQAQFYTDMISNNIITPLLSGEFDRRCMISSIIASLNTWTKLALFG